MNKYELYTPIGELFFEAESDKVATWVALYIGQGKTQCSRIEGEDRVKLNTVILEEEGSKDRAAKYFGMPFNEYLKKNNIIIGNCLLSFDSNGNDLLRGYVDRANGAGELLINRNEQE